MPDNDKLFKELLSNLFIEFVDLFFPDLSQYLDATSVQLLDKELFVNVAAGETHEADLVIKAQYQGQNTFFLVHIEAQAQYQKSFSQRMFSYFARLYDKYQLPVYPIAIFSYNSAQKQEPSEHVIAFPNFQVLQFNYRTVQLSRLAWRDYVNSANPVAAALMAKMKIAPQDRVKVKLECLRLLVTLKVDPARSELIGNFINTYLKLTAAEERQFEQAIQQIIPPQKEELMELLTGWHKRGHREGLRKGRKEGLQQGLKQSVLSLLQHKFGQLDANDIAQIERLSLAQLEALISEILSFHQYQDWQTWLQSIERSAKANSMVVNDDNFDDNGTTQFN
jgi:hypothetical protein